MIGNTIMDMLFGQNTGVNFDNLTMAQKRTQLGNMFDPMEEGRERLRAMTAPEVTPGAGMNPMLAQALLSGGMGLLSQQKPQMMPVMPMQQTIRGMQLPQVNLQQYYRGLI